MMNLFAKNNQKKSKVRGFTLIELMVASTGALFITVGVYAFTRNVTDYFQRQMRLSDATMNAVTGFERLRTDIQRAGFLASPNLARDPLRCPRPASGGIAMPPQQIGNQFDSYPGLQQMGLAQLEFGVTSGSYPSNFMLAQNGAGGINPDRLTLYGNYSSTEQFPAKAAPPGASQIILDADSIAMRRLGIPTGSTTTDEDLLASVFQPGRIVRVVDAAGRHQYAILANPSVDFTIDPQGDATLFLSPLVELIDKAGTAGTTCGMRGHGGDLVVNPVDIVRYQLVDLNDGSYPQFGALFANVARPPYDTTRLDLIREQLDPRNFSVFPGTTELITEYAVDLKFGLTVNTNTVTGANTYFGEDSASLVNYADDPTGSNAGQVGPFGPHLIRGIHARLSVRTREADHAAPLLTGTTFTNASSEALYRVAVANGQYARLRSLRAHIATRNTRSETWQ